MCWCGILLSVMKVNHFSKPSIIDWPLASRKEREALRVLSDSFYFAVVWTSLYFLCPLAMSYRTTYLLTLPSSDTPRFYPAQNYVYFVQGKSNISTWLRYISVQGFLACHLLLSGPVLASVSRRSGNRALYTKKRSRFDLVDKSRAAARSCKCVAGCSYSVRSCHSGADWRKAWRIGIIERG